FRSSAKANLKQAGQKAKQRSLARKAETTLLRDNQYAILIYLASASSSPLAAKRNVDKFERQAARFPLALYDAEDQTSRLCAALWVAEHQVLLRGGGLRYVPVIICATVRCEYAASARTSAHPGGAVSDAIRADHLRLDPSCPCQKLLHKVPGIAR